MGGRSTICVEGSIVELLVHVKLKSKEPLELTANLIERDRTMHTA